MHCPEARRLLNRDLVPGRASAQQSALGFHLVGCSECRDYRAMLEDEKLLAQMLVEASHTASIAPKARPMPQAIRVVSAAVLAGIALTSVPSGGVRSAMAAPAQPLQSSAFLVQRSARTAAQQAVAERLATQERVNTAAALLQARRSDEALLAELLAAPIEANSAQALAAAPSDEALLAELLAAPVEAPALEVDLAAPANAPALSELDAVLQQAGGVYRVVAGDYLWGLSQRFYGDPLLWTAIYRRNQEVIGSNPNQIYPGQSLNIPNLEEARRLAGQGPVPVPPITQPGRTYVVQPGDTLWDISARYYGSGGYYSSISAVNAIQNPNVIYPGQVVYIP